nr:MAG TPA: hypothetical protein [Caudoviricetes sp.]
MFGRAIVSALHLQLEIRSDFERKKIKKTSSVV